MFALLGPLERTYPLGALPEARIMGDRVVVGTAQLPIRKGRCDPRAWAGFAASVQWS